MIGDGICQDECNFDDFENDGLDCCKENIQKEIGSLCDCICHIDGLKHPFGPPKSDYTFPILMIRVRDWTRSHLIGPCLPQFKGDGQCDDVCNTYKEQYDDGDCCLDGKIDDAFCTNCFCYANETRFPSSNCLGLLGPQQYVGLLVQLLVIVLYEIEFLQCFAPLEFMVMAFVTMNVTWKITILTKEIAAFKMKSSLIFAFCVTASLLRAAQQL